MAVINSWDLTDANTGIYAHVDGQTRETSECVYMVRDLGSTFGSAHLTLPLGKVRGNVYEYARSRFPETVTDNYVNFGTPGLDFLFLLPDPKDYFTRLREYWIGRRIPRADARYIGEVLARLSQDQIRDVFRAAEYSAEEAEGFARALQRRIAIREAL